ncbi:MAG: NAD(+) synthase [Candidatus Lokiarchaeia archaeon]
MTIDILRALTLDYEKVFDKLCNFIKSSLDLFEKDGVVIGLSGGIDSAVTASLSVKALGPDKVLGLILPERDSEAENIKDAKYLAEKLKINYKTINLSPIFRRIGLYDILPNKVAKNKKELEKRFRNIRRSSTFTMVHSRSLIGLNTSKIKSGPATAFAMTKVRLRSVIINYYARYNNYISVGSTNKTEYTIGHYDKHGDGACDISPLLPLYKTQVKQLAKFLGVPRKIIMKAPSPDILIGKVITDEFIIGMSFDQLDAILYLLENGMKNSQIAERLNIDVKIVDDIQNAIENEGFRSTLPLTPEISDLT